MEESIPKNKALNLTLVATILLVLAVVVGVGTSLQKAKPQSQVLGEDIQTNDIQLEAGSFYFKPNIIKVKSGQTVTITLKSMDMMHDFVVDELGIKVPITKSGETNTFTFTANQKGEFTFYCSVGQHRQNGQVGTLIVE
jgi:heme/copper-type cytochrome/quinol oxidase subunit 2